MLKMTHLSLANAIIAFAKHAGLSKPMPQDKAQPALLNSHTAHLYLKINHPGIDERTGPLRVFIGLDVALVGLLSSEARGEYSIFF